MEIQEILNQRQKTHGEFSEHAGTTQAIKQIIQNRNHRNLSDSQLESLEMIAHKIGRILAGDPNTKDHWDDIAGYAKLISNQIDKANESN